MTDPATERTQWTLVQLREDQPATSSGDADEGLDTLASTESAPADPPTGAIQLPIQPPNDAAREVLVVKADLSDAEAVLAAVVRDGFWTHGFGFFDALRAAFDAPLLDEYQGSEKPLRVLPPDVIATLVRVGAEAVSSHRKEIEAALASVQAMAATYAVGRLSASSEEIIAHTIRYVAEVPDHTRAIRWLEADDLSRGAYVFTFNSDAGIDLARSLFTLLPFHRALASKDGALAGAMKKAGPEMQRIVSERWQFLRGQDPKNTLGANDNEFSTDYGLRLLKAVNAKRPDLVALSREKFPDPVAVTSARDDALKAAAALTATLADEGAEHPILYRIWNAGLAADLSAIVNRPGAAQTVDARVLSSVFAFRVAVSQALRSSYQAAKSLGATLEHAADHVWRFAFLIEAATQSLGLSDDAFALVAANHRLDQLTEEAELKQRLFTRASDVLMAAAVLVRLVPAPQLSVPAGVAIAVIDTVVSGLGLLTQYFQEADNRDGFRAFLTPGESFAASDGSFLGILVGAAFLLFGTAGLSRSTLSAVPGKGEAAVVVGVVAENEYSALTSGERR